MLQTNSVFLVVLLLLGRKTEKIFEAFQNSSLKRQSENWNIRKVKWSLAGNNIPINGPILLEKAHEFAKAFNYNDFTASNYGCSNVCSSVPSVQYCTSWRNISCLFFSKFGRNNLNCYNSKTHVIQTNFESPWGFELYEFNCISAVPRCICIVLVRVNYE